MLTRRSFFSCTNQLIAAVAAPQSDPSLSSTSTGNSSVMADLSHYTSEANNKVVPDEVIEKMKLHVMDTLAAMISGSQLAPGRAAIKFAGGYGSEGTATVVGSKTLCGPIEAALANGVLAHSDETDDSHAQSGGHPGSAVVPAALAVGEQFGIDGAHFLRAAILGYDIGTRVTMTMGPEAFKDVNHRSAPSVVGIFGAAAAAGCAASLTQQQMCWVLDYAVQQSSGIAAWQRDTQHFEKAFVFGGMPARSGVTAVLLVQSGCTGVNDILTGTDNFFSANAPQADPLGLIQELGERFEVTRTNVKKWTVGSPIQAPLDALEILRQRHPFELEQLEQLTVRVATHMAATVNNRDMPDICLQHMIAVMLVDKTVSFRSAHDKARMSDPAILRQRSKVRLVADAELQSHMPRREAIVEVRLTDGSRFSQFVGAVRGTTDNPMTREEIAAKSRDLIIPVIGATACENLVRKVFDLGKMKDIRELRPLLQATH